MVRRMTDRLSGKGIRYGVWVKPVGNSEWAYSPLFRWYRYQGILGHAVRQAPEFGFCQNAKKSVVPATGSASPLAALQGNASFPAVA